MASCDSVENHVKKIVEIVCFHCNKKVVAHVKCKKCKHFFHPACLQQASVAKTAVCRHIPDEEKYNLQNESSYEEQIAELKRMLHDMQAKYICLEKNHQRLAEKLGKLEESLAQKENSVLKEPATSQGNRNRRKHTVDNVEASKHENPPSRKRDGQPVDIVQGSIPVDTVQRSVTLDKERQVTETLKASRVRNRDGVNKSPKRRTRSTSNVVAFDDPPIQLNNFNSEDSNEVIVDVKTDISKNKSKRNNQENMENNENSRDENETNHQWTKVQSRKSRKKSEAVGKRPVPSVGVNEKQTNLKIVESTRKGDLLFWIFLSGFDPKTKEADILDFLKVNKLNEGCRCFKMKTRTDGIKSSFKLGVPLDRQQQYMNSGLWPTGTLINHFQNLQCPPVPLTNRRENLGV